MKMERRLKHEQNTIYEIFRACRLCGGGSGFKMPIITTLPNDDEDTSLEVELRQKIRECVQIEVMSDDKMPPLICELCMDKINDFYEFLEMCRQTNKRTRLRLGLPPQTLPHGAPDAGDCILGLTEPVFSNDHRTDTQFRHKGKVKKTSSSANKIRRPPTPEPEVKITRSSAKDHNSRHSTPGRSTRDKVKIEVTPKRVTRQCVEESEDTMKLSRIKQNEQEKVRNSRNSTPHKGIIKRDVKDLCRTVPTKLTKRSVNTDSKYAPAVKKVKIAIKPLPAETRAKPGALTCVVCKLKFSRTQALSSHMRLHAATFTPLRLACNACGEWFPSPEASAAHHRRHRAAEPYRCRLCRRDYADHAAYNSHVEDNECEARAGKPDIQCGGCWRYFPTQHLVDQHRCPGADGRPGGSCNRCLKPCPTYKKLKRHELSCKAKKREYNIRPELLEQIKPLQIRMRRCDQLLGCKRDGRYNVNQVKPDFGFDPSCEYPYATVSIPRIKRELTFDGMVNIKDEFLDYDDNFVHWDSDSEVSEDMEMSDFFTDPIAKRRKVNSLVCLSLKSIFSEKYLGKVPRKRRRMKSVISKAENLLDSLLRDEVENEGETSGVELSDESRRLVSDEQSETEEGTAGGNCEGTSMITDTELDVSVKINDIVSDSVVSGKGSVENNVECNTDSAVRVKINDSGHNSHVDITEILNSLEEDVCKKVIDNETNIGLNKADVEMENTSRQLETEECSNTEDKLEKDIINDVETKQDIDDVMKDERTVESSLENDANESMVKESISEVIDASKSEIVGTEIDQTMTDVSEEPIDKINENVNHNVDNVNNESDEETAIDNSALHIKDNIDSDINEEQKISEGSEPINVNMEDNESRNNDIAKTNSTSHVTIDINEFSNQKVEEKDSAQNEIADAEYNEEISTGADNIHDNTDTETVNTEDSQEIGEEPNHQGHPKDDDHKNKHRTEDLSPSRLYEPAESDKDIMVNGAQNNDSIETDDDIDDKRLMDAIDAQIGDHFDKTNFDHRQVDALTEDQENMLLNDDPEQTDVKETLEDLVNTKDNSMDLDSISDDDFNFD